MATLHIVCAQQAAGTAAALERRLTAEGHSVTPWSGRAALLALGNPHDGSAFVIVIWSPEAETQPYVAEWAARTDPDRLIELALSTPYPPKIHRRASVIDFTGWRGERGGRAWNALSERLRSVVRAAELAKTPPKQAAAALVAMGALVIGGGVMVRMETAPTPDVAYTPEPAPVYTAPTGVGGSEIASVVEPPSAAEALGGPRVPPRIPSLVRYQSTSLDEVEPLGPIELRDPSLIERFLSLNPLRSNRRDRN
jgi:hypothetical protein